MHNSHPVKCEHNFKYCDACSVVYCGTCKEEWKHTYYSYSSWTTWPSTSTSSGTTPLYNLASHTHNENQTIS